MDCGGEDQDIMPSQGRACVFALQITGIGYGGIARRQVDGDCGDGKSMAIFTPILIMTAIKRY